MADVVVIGAGHNGLVAACYLARAGLEVVVVERDVVVGGAVSTVERFPGFRVDRGSSAHIMIRHTGIVEDLRLAEVGLDYQDLDPWGFAPFGAGEQQQAITFWVDLDRTCASIEAVCGARDADAYRRFVRDWSARNDVVFAAFQRPPTGPRLGRAAWALSRGGRPPVPELTRQFLTSGDALLDEWFRDERLKTALAWLGAQAGPPTHESATADLVGWGTMLHRRAPGHPRGGSGMLSVALRRRLESFGGRVVLGDAVTEITWYAGRVSGVRTASGDHVAAPSVLAACHVLTALELAGRPALLERALRTARTGNGMGLAVRLATTALPAYPAAGPDSHRGLQLLAPSRTALRRAHGQFVAGETPSAPPVVAMSFSAFDDSLAPPGQHSITLWGQWHPYSLSGGRSWADIAEREGDKLVAAVDRLAPGFAGSVQQMHVQSPVELERELGLRGGQVMHLEMTLDQMFRWRPLPELAGYRVPGHQGLYLCGASTHPGGGVFGASGRSAAAVLLADRRRRRFRPAPSGRTGRRSRGWPWSG